MVAATIYASLEGDDGLGLGTAAAPYQSLSKCLLSAVASDTVVLDCAAAECVFRGTSNVGLSVTKTITVTAAAGKVVVLDGETISRVMDISGAGITVTLQNLSLRGGQADHGGALRVIDATVSLNMCKVSMQKLCWSNSDVCDLLQFESNTATGSAVSCLLYTSPSPRDS